MILLDCFCLKNHRCKQLTVVLNISHFSCQGNQLLIVKEVNSRHNRTVFVCSSLDFIFTNLWCARTAVCLLGLNCFWTFGQVQIYQGVGNKLNQTGYKLTENETSMGASKCLPNKNCFVLSLKKETTLLGFKNRMKQFSFDWC